LAASIPANKWRSIVICFDIQTGAGQISRLCLTFHIASRWRQRQCAFSATACPPAAGQIIFPAGTSFAPNYA